jgi:hypothetical protein
MTILDPIYEDATYAPDPLSAFGPIVSAFEVEHAVADNVRVWIRDYLAETARQRQLAATWPPFRSIVLSAHAQWMPEDQTPALLIVSPGTEPTASGDANRMEVRGDGGLIARWRVDAAAVISARGNRQAVRLARFYAAALRTIFITQALQPCPLNVRRVDIVGERYDLLEASADRTQCAGIVRIGVEVANVSNRLAGPLEPILPPTDPADTPPPMAWPEAISAEATVTKQEE